MKSHNRSGTLEDWWIRKIPCGIRSRRYLGRWEDMQSEGFLEYHKYASGSDP